MSVSTLELREKSLELWDYSVADKLVYFCDVAIHETEGRSKFIGWPTEYKLGRRGSKRTLNLPAIGTRSSMPLSRSSSPLSPPGNRWRGCGR